MDILFLLAGLLRLIKALKSINIRQALPTTTYDCNIHFKWKVCNLMLK